MSQNNTETREEFTKRILYEDNHLVIMNKLAGELAQGDDTGELPLVEKVRDYIRVQKQKEGNVFCGLIHRIDRPVSGALAFARTSKALDRMNKLLKAHEIHKFYWAIVEGVPEIPQQKLVNWVFKNSERNKTYINDQETEAGSTPNWTIGCWPIRSGIRSWRSSCTPAATTRSACNCRISVIPSRAT